MDGFLWACLLSAGAGSYGGPQSGHGGSSLSAGRSCATSVVGHCVLLSATKAVASSAATSAPTVLLDRWARHGPVGAEDAAIARLRLKPGTAAAAVIKEPASVGRHGLCGLVPALRAGQGRSKLHQVTYGPPTRTYASRRAEEDKRLSLLRGKDHWLAQFRQ
jgi:hypothetical protein